MSEEQETGCEKEEKSRITPKILVQPSGRMELSVYRGGGPQRLSLGQIHFEMYGTGLCQRCANT